MFGWEILAWLRMKMQIPHTSHERPMDLFRARWILERHVQTLCIYFGAQDMYFAICGQDALKDPQPEGRIYPYDFFDDEEERQRVDARPQMPIGRIPCLVRNGHG